MGPLYVASKEGHLDVVKVLLEAGASMEVALEVSGGQQGSGLGGEWPSTLWKGHVDHPWGLFVQEGGG